MSSISSRPRVQKIAGPVLTTVAAAGAVLVAKALKALLSSPATPQTPALPAEQGLQPAATLKEEFRRNRGEILEQVRGKLPAVEALRVASLTSIGSTPFYIENPAALQPHYHALQTATTQAKVQKAEQALLGALVGAHHQVFVNTLALACQRAAARLGFDRVDVVRLPAEVRVIAADAAGRTLVSEVQADMRREPALATEVVGVMDGSCRQLLDDFDRALEEEGVRSAPPRRKYTGGVCELAGAREVARNRWKPLAKAATAPQPQQRTSTSRAQRLNAPQTVTVRSKG